MNIEIIWLGLFSLKTSSLWRLPIILSIWWRLIKFFNLLHIHCICRSLYLAVYLGLRSTEDLTDHMQNIKHPIFSYRLLSYPILSCRVLSYPIVSYLILSYPILSNFIPSNPILSHLILSYLISSYPILSYLISSYPILSNPILCYAMQF
jgi:hypothetical protein